VFASKNETDPVFGKALREAAAEGVEVYAHSSEFIGNRITLRGKLKVELAPMLRGNQQIVEHVDLLLVLPLLFEKFYCFPTEFGQVSGTKVAPAFFRSVATDFQHVAFLPRNTSASISI